MKSTILLRLQALDIWCWVNAQNKKTNKNNPKPVFTFWFKKVGPASFNHKFRTLKHHLADGFFTSSLRPAALEFQYRKNGVLK